MAQVFRHTGAITPQKSVFDLSHELKTTFDMGTIIPIMCLTVIPSDVIDQRHELVMRLNPQINPVLHEINLFTWSFFVPLRLLDEDWENFITGGKDGLYEKDVPRWSGTKPSDGQICQASLWDYLAFGMSYDDSANVLPIDPETLPTDYVLRAYNFIYNNYFRDQNLEPEIMYPYDVQAVVEADNGTSDSTAPGQGAYAWTGYYQAGTGTNPWNAGTNLFYGNWEKDYFTVALPWQQRGISPGISLFGELSVSPGDLTFAGVPTAFSGSTVAGAGNTIAGSLSIAANNGLIDGSSIGRSLTVNISPNNYTPSGTIQGSIDTSKLSAGDINDLRTDFQVQKYLERNARIGARYFESLHGRWKTPILDIRLDRPEYIGGSRSPVLISEVLQTAQSNVTVGGQPAGNNNVLGAMGGHGITADSTYIGKYRVHEWGYIMTLACVKPRAVYSQGIDREFTFKTKYDLPAPEFVNLSEQGIQQQELFFNGTGDDNIWGFEGMFDHFRYKKSNISGLFRTPSFETWHLARKFANAPQLNYEFIKIDPDQTKRIFAVTDEHGLLLNAANIIKAIRPLPIIAEPGLIDHH